MDLVRPGEPLLYGADDRHAAVGASPVLFEPGPNASAVEDVLAAGKEDCGALILGPAFQTDGTLENRVRRKPNSPGLLADLI